MPTSCNFAKNSNIFQLSLTDLVGTCLVEHLPVHTSEIQVNSSIIRYKIFVSTIVCLYN